MCGDFSTFGLSIGFMLGSQPRLSAVLSALLIASLHPLPSLLFASDSFRVRLRMADWCLHGSLWYHGVAVYLAVLTLRVRCCRTVVGGRYLCLYCCHTILGDNYKRLGTCNFLVIVFFLRYQI